MACKRVTISISMSSVTGTTLSDRSVCERLGLPLSAADDKDEEGREVVLPSAPCSCLSLLLFVLSDEAELSKEPDKELEDDGGGGKGRGQKMCVTASNVGKEPFPTPTFLL